MDKVETNLLSNEELVEDAVSLLETVWQAMDWDNINGRRRMNIYNEFRDAVEESADVRNLSRYLDRLTENMSVRSLNDPEAIEIIENSDGDELLRLFRQESQYLVLKLRERRGNLETSAPDLSKTFDE